MNNSSAPHGSKPDRPEFLTSKLAHERLKAAAKELDAAKAENEKLKAENKQLRELKAVATNNTKPAATVPTTTASKAPAAKPEKELTGLARTKASFAKQFSKQIKR